MAMDLRTSCAEDAEDRSARHVKIDAVNRAQVAECLDETARNDGGRVWVEHHFRGHHEVIDGNAGLYRMVSV
jgi:hypothetical protein